MAKISLRDTPGSLVENEFLNYLPDSVVAHLGRDVTLFTGYSFVGQMGEMAEYASHQASMDVYWQWARELNIVVIQMSDGAAALERISHQEPLGRIGSSLVHIGDVSEISSVPGNTL